jgi:monoamine oxidase
MQRRKFIKNTLLASGGALGLGACEDKTAINRDRKFEGTVAIIGAGAAGLYAGYLLEENKTNYTIFEASDQIGGRVRSLKGLVDFEVELGAEEIHGKNSEWYKWVKDSGAGFVSDNATDYYQIGNLLRTESQLSGDVEFRAAQTAIQQATNYSGADVNLVQYMENLRLAARVRHVVEAQVANEYGAAPNRLSVRGITEEDQAWSAGSDNYAVSNRALLTILRDKCSAVLPKVKLNTPIKRIDYAANARVSIEDAQGLRQSFDKVLITVPLTILQNSEIQFSPALPDAKLNALKRIGMGAGMKVILAFSRRFWAADTGCIISSGAIPKYWVSSLGRSSQAFVLTGFVMGSKAEALSGLPTATAIQTVVRDLDAMYGAGVASGALVNARIMDWTKEPFIKGAYSYPLVGGGGLATRQDLAAPVQRKLYFAGEATHYGGHSGTVHGAMESSQRAVEELLREIE